MTEPTLAHLEAIADEALKTYLPADWHIKWIKDYMKSAGVWQTADKTKQIYRLEIGHPTTPQALFVLLHELGHLVDYKTNPGIAENRRSDPMAVLFEPAEELDPGGPYNECRASRWAKAYMLQHGLVVPADIWGIAVREMHSEEQEWINKGHNRVTLSKG